MLMQKYENMSGGGHKKRAAVGWQLFLIYCYRNTISKRVRAI